MNYIIPSQMYAFEHFDMKTKCLRKSYQKKKTETFPNVIKFHSVKSIYFKRP